MAHEIATAIRNGADPENFLVIVSDSALTDQIIEALNRRADGPIAYDPKNGTLRNRVRVTSLNAATGLESPIVFLCGLDSLLEAESALGLAEDERAELIRDNTRRIYMAITRAMSKLVITFRRSGTKALLFGT